MQCTPWVALPFERLEGKEWRMVKENVWDAFGESVIGMSRQPRSTMEISS